MKEPLRRVTARADLVIRLDPTESAESAEMDALANAIADARPSALLETRLLREPVAVPDEPTAAAVADALAVEAGYHAIGTWSPVPRGAAEEFLAWLLGHDMAYRSELMAKEQASALARRFLDRFGATPYCLCNRTWLGPGAYASAPIAPSTFDGGIVAVGAGAAGILWFEDED
jgi:hypothetical protein